MSAKSGPDLDALGLFDLGQKRDRPLPVAGIARPHFTPSTSSEASSMMTSSFNDASGNAALRTGRDR